MTVFMCAFPFRSQGAFYGNTSAFDYFFFVWNRLELICSNVSKYMDGGKKQLSGISAVSSLILSELSRSSNEFVLFCQLKS